MDNQQVIYILEALAVGDSFGKSTEFASREQIKNLGFDIDRLLLPSESIAHKDMRYAQITDDTEQNLFLIEDYANADKITPQVAADSILRWYNSTPEPDKYIGPSTAKAIAAIKNHESVYTSGIGGASCGGVMRAPAAVLCSNSIRQLQDNVFATLCPTHNTSAALEAAMGYAYAMWSMQSTKDIGIIISEAEIGCDYGASLVKQSMDAACHPSCKMRLQFLVQRWESFSNQNQLLDFLFYIYGCTISSCDVFVAAFAIFLWAKSDVFLAIKMAAQLGGDTDTVGCLAAVLCCTYAETHNIPKNITQSVITSNKLDFDKISNLIIQIQNDKRGIK